MIKRCFTYFLLLFPIHLIGQLPTVEFLPLNQLVQNVLLGQNVVVSNIQFNDDANYAGNQIGKFTYNGSLPMFQTGIVMGTGGVAKPDGTSGGMIGPNNDTEYNFTIIGSTVSNDVELATIANPNSIYDIGRLEFDFVPNGNTVSFKFIFGSEEYNEWTCSFSDVFGFFVTGKNPCGQDYVNTNFALVPNTTFPISTRTINSMPYGCNNQIGNNIAYFDGQPGGNFGTPNNDFQMDGATTQIEIKFNVVIGETYHFKFAIADNKDPILDSWVFLQAGSFESTIGAVSVTDNLDEKSTIIRGCNNGEITFVRPNSTNDSTYVLHLNIGGSASSNVDYVSFPDSVIFYPNQDSTTIIITPINYANAPDLDSITIEFTTVNVCGDTIVNLLTYYLVISPEIVLKVPDVTIDCTTNPAFEITATALGGAPPYYYEWDNGVIGQTININTNDPLVYKVFVTDACGFKDTIDVVVNLAYNLKIDSLIAHKEDCSTIGDLTAVVSGNSNETTYNWFYIDNDTISLSSALTIANISTSGMYYFEVNEHYCHFVDSIFLDLEVPVAVLKADSVESCGEGTFVLQNNSLGATNFSWKIGDNVIQTTAQTNQTISISETTEIILIASKNGCSDTTSILLKIHEIPKAKIVPDTTFGCSPATFTLDNQSENATIFYWNTGGGYQVTTDTSSQILNLTNSQHVFLIASNGYCSDTASLLLNVTKTPNAKIIPSNTQGCNPSEFSFVNESTDALEYEWNILGNTFSVTDNGSQSAQFYGDSSTSIPVSHVISLTAKNGECFSSSTVVIKIMNCGCTDKIASNYSENAGIDDGSCIYQDAEIILPNIFTPNEDGINDTYQFVVQKNVVSIEYWILNRWGNIVFYTNELNDYWNGKINNKDATDGVYFIKYKAVGSSGKESSGQTFFHLNR